MWILLLVPLIITQYVNEVVIKPMRTGKEHLVPLDMKETISGRNASGR